MADGPASLGKKTLEELKSEAFAKLERAAMKFAGKRELKLDRYLSGALRSQNQMLLTPSGNIELQRGIALQHQ